MPRLLASCLALVAVTVPCTAQGWPNSGGNAQRNGLSTAYGPLSQQVVWTVNRSSFISHQPIIAGDRVFVVRDVPHHLPRGPEDSPVFCYDLQTGAELWRTDIPYLENESRTWVLGTSNGLVYASRAYSALSARIHALDQATGETVWVSEGVIDANGCDGVVFAPNGDPIVASWTMVWRIRAADGTTAWSTRRSCANNFPCGGVIFGSAVYVAEGPRIKRLHLPSGNLAYQGSSPFSGTTPQQTPMVGSDGTVYINQAVGSGVHRLLAWKDTGRGFELKWNVFSARVPVSEYGIGIDGSVYMLQPNLVLAALNPANGVLRATYPRPFGYNNMRCTVDADGRLYVSDGGFPTGRLYSFNPDLTLRWSLPFERLGKGGPALGHDGTLVICDVNKILGLRTPSPWTNVGGGISGVTGSPTLLGRGTMTSGNDIVLLLANARPGALGTLLIGGSVLGLPLLGGTLVPSPDLVVSGFPIGPRGNLDVTLTWPPGVPAGTGLWFQHWYLDPAAVQGVAASNGLRGITP